MILSQLVVLSCQGGPGLAGLGSESDIDVVKAALRFAELQRHAPIKFLYFSGLHISLHILQIILPIQHNILHLLHTEKGYV
jgi:hypothetical protein